MIRVVLIMACTLCCAGGGCAQTVEGIWRGKIESRSKEAIEFELTVNGQGAEPAGRIQPVGRGMVSPFFLDSAAVETDGTVKIEIKTLRVVIEGKLSPDGRVIQGTWTQFGTDRQPLRLNRSAAATPPSFPDPLVEIRIPKAPTLVNMGGAQRVFYEIHVLNFGQDQIELEQVEVQIGERRVPIAREELARAGLSYGVSIPPTKSGGVLMGLTFERDAPAVLGHRVTMRIGERVTTLVAQALPIGRDAVRIGPPLRGKGWWAGNGPDSSLHHRAAALPMDGRLTIAQRFAYDFARRVPDSTEFERGDYRKLESSPSYGADVLAVADATVSMVRDGLPDAPPYELAPPHAITKETLGGNLVVLDLGQGRWAVYAHLQSGSVAVKLGDRVRKGEVIARLGNSASYSSHLHFQVVDGPEPFSSEGIPFVIDEFVHEGTVHREEMPRGGWTIDFRAQ